MYQIISTGVGTRFSCQHLSFFFREIAHQINLLNDDDQLWERTAPCAFIEDSYFLRYITLGEVFFELKNVFMCLLSDKQANPMPLFREAIFSSFYEFSTQSFLRGFECGGFSEIKDDALNLWGLYEFCSLEANLFVWSDEDCKEVEAPPLETLTLNDWQRVVERLDSLFFQDSDWEMFSHFSQFEEKPHLPSFVEHRDTVVWFEDICRSCGATGEPIFGPLRSYYFG